MNSTQMNKLEEISELLKGKLRPAEVIVDEKAVSRERFSNAVKL
jgi:hypothetical protein